MTNDLTLPPDVLRDGEIVGNCGLVAMAVVAGCTVAEAEAAYRQAHKTLTGRQPGGRWRGGTRCSIRLTAMKLLGVRLERVELPSKQRMTLKTWALLYARPSRRYVVTVTGHVLVLMIRQRGGLREFDVIDQYGLRQLSATRSQNKIVREVLEV